MECLYRAAWSPTRHVSLVLVPRFDVYPLPSGGQGYVVDIQADLLSHLLSRIVVPLVPLSKAPRPIAELNPVFEIEGELYVLLTQALASIPRRELKRVVSSLRAHHDQITRSLDILLTGY